MDIKALRYFVEVVRQNGFRRASTTLHITQPAVSRAIGQLEEEFDMTFLIREPRGVRLTPEGEVLYRQAGLILRQAHNLTSELQDLRTTVMGALRVGLPPATSSTFFGTVITEFRRRYPRVELHIAEYGSNQLEAALIDGRIEMAAALLPMEGGGFLTQTFARGRLALLCSREHPLAARKKIVLRDLAEEPFIVFTEDFKINDLIERLCRVQGFVPTIAGRSSHLDLITSMVTSGMGIALLPETVCKKVKSAHLTVLPITSPVMSYELALVRHRDSYLSRAGRGWADIAAEVLEFDLDPSFVA